MRRNLNRFGGKESNIKSYIHPNICKADKVFEKIKDFNLTKINIANPINKDEKPIRCPRKAK